MSVGRCGARALMALPEADRVATAPSSGSNTGRSASQPAGSSRLQAAFPRRGARGVGRAPRGETLAPGRVRGRAALPGLLVERLHVVGHEEGRLERPARRLSLVSLTSSTPSGAPCAPDVSCLFGEPQPMCVRTAISDGRARLGLGGADRRVDGLDVVAVGDLLHVPAVGLEARADVFGEGEVGGAVDGDVVVVVEDDELAQLLVTGERGGLAADALHHVAVAGEHVGEVVHDARRVSVERRPEKALGDGHADGVGEALAEGPGGGLDAGGVPVLGMAGRLAAPLAERLQVVEAQVVAGEMEQGVEQHARVARRQHEAVAVGPGRIGRVEAEMAREQRVRHGGRTHRHAGMTGLGLLHAVDGQKADGVDAALFEGLCARHWAHLDPFDSSWSGKARQPPTSRDVGRAEAADGRHTCVRLLRSTRARRSRSARTPQACRE